MKVGVIADDLTGGNGTGVLLVKCGFTAITKFDSDQLEDIQDNSVVCIVTDSRYINQEDAKHKCLKASLDLYEWNVDVLCKRIDSTFRGNIGQEIDGILKSNERAIAIVVPTYPSLKRITVGGYLLVNDIPLQETDVRNDPIKPILNSYLPFLLEKQTKNKIGLIELQNICLGSASIRKEIYNNINQGNRIIICDAVTEHHIEEIAKAMAGMNDYDMCPADSGLLTEYYVRERMGNTILSPDTAYSNIVIKDEKVNNCSNDHIILASIGSITPITKKQIDYLNKNMSVKPIYANPMNIISSEYRQKEIERVVCEALKVVSNNMLVLVTTIGEKYSKLDLKKISIQEATTEDRIADRITNGLAHISKLILKASKGKINRCYFSGGDMTAAFCKVAKADGIQLLGEVMPIVAYGRIIGSEFSGLHIVTKGGLLGKEDTLYDCIAYLKNI